MPELSEEPRTIEVTEMTDRQLMELVCAQQGAIVQGFNNLAVGLQVMNDNQQQLLGFVERISTLADAFGGGGGARGSMLTAILNGGGLPDLGQK